jgi:hypothetical protein
LVLCLTKVCTSEEKYCYQGLHDMAANVQGLAKCGTSAFRLPGLLKLIIDLLFKL